MTGKSNTVAAMTSTGKDDWKTPPAVLDALNAEFGFILDAASSGPSFPMPQWCQPVPWLGPGGVRPDGLDPWPSPDDCIGCLSPGWAGSVPAAWLNSPYSRAAGRGQGIKAWHERAWLESRNGWTVVVLCPPHPGRRWMQEFGRKADEVRVYKRRLAFIDPATGEAVRGNTQDSCLVVYRPHVPAAGWPGGPRWSWVDVPS